MRAWWKSFIAHLAKFNHSVTALLVASLGSLQYAHDNLTMVQPYLDTKMFHWIAAGLTIAIFVAHMVETMPKGENNG